MIGFYWLNRLRGTYSIFAKINAVIIGAIFWFVIDTPLSMLSFWQYMEASLNEIITWLDIVLPVAISIVSLPVDTLALFTIPTMIAVGYLAGESIGWGDWIGQQNGSKLECGEEGEKNGIKWLASKFAACGTENYNKIALVIRGAYWWTPTLLPLMFVMNPATVLLAIIALSFGFQISQDWTGNDGKKSWNDAEYIYGGIQDLVLILLIGYYYAV